MNELLGQISSREITEWMAYDKLEPFGERRADLRAGIVASTVANVFRNAKEHPRAFRADEFMPDFERGLQRQTWEEQLALVEMLNAAFGGRDLRKQ